MPFDYKGLFINNATQVFVFSDPLSQPLPWPNSYTQANSKGKFYPLKCVKQFINSPRLACRFAWHCEECCHSQSRSSRHSIHVHPEGDPWDDHDQDGGDVGLDNVKAERPGQLEFCHQTAVITCKKKSIKLLIVCGFYSMLWCKKIWSK